MKELLDVVYTKLGVPFRYSIGLCPTLLNVNPEALYGRLCLATPNINPRAAVPYIYIINPELEIGSQDTQYQ